MAASISASRFAVLNIEGSDDDKKKRAKGPSDAQKLKKNKKKPKSADQNNLRSLAFGSGKSHGTNKSSEKVPASTQQLEEWQQHDREIVEDMYEQQLQQALLASRIEQEQKMAANHHADGSDNDDSIEQDTAAVSQDNKKKKKKKKKTLTMAEFQRDGSPQDEHENKEKPPVEQTTKGSGVNENFFEAVDSSAAKLIKKDKMQDEYTKQYKVQAVLNAKHTAELEERDKMIADLRNKLLEAQVEVQQVKKRNKQLCYMLAQGEMKDKSEILQQVDSLTSLKNELTAQLSTMSTEMEKERSKVHSLQNELAKTKAKSK